MLSQAGVLFPERSSKMENLVNLITNGSTEFTPQVMIGLIAFCLVLETIGSIAGTLVRFGGRP